MWDIILGLLIPKGNRNEARGSGFIIFALLFCGAISLGLWLLAA
jgi:hypothetical protein